MSALKLISSSFIYPARAHCVSECPSDSILLMDLEACPTDCERDHSICRKTHIFNNT